MLDAFRSFFKTPEDAIAVNRGKLLPLLRWFSFSPRNLQKINKINLHAFWVPYDIVYSDIHFNIDKRERFIKYLKKGKLKENVVLMDCLKRKYKCGKTELNKNWDIIEPQLTKEMLKEMATAFGLNDKECRALKVKLDKPKLKIEEKKQKTLLGF